MDEAHELDAFCNVVAKTIARRWGVKFEVVEQNKNNNVLKFSSGTLKKKYEERVKKC